MKNIEFQKFKIQNFLSIGDTPLELEFKPGINIITGENHDIPGSRNGVGKTSILNAIYWIIFGETISELKKSRIRNSKTKEECSGVLHFKVDEDQYIISRILEPSSVKILKNGKDITLSTIDENSEFIKKLIGANQEVFRYSVIVTADDTIPFLALKKIEKRKFLEGIMDLNIFGQMLAQVRKDYNEEKKKSDIESSKYTNLQKKLKDYQDQKSNNLVVRSNKIKELKNRYDSNIEEIRNLQSGEIPLDIIENEKSENTKDQNLIETLETIDLIAQQNKFNEVQTKYHVLISEKKKDLDTIKRLKDKTGDCPLCKRPLMEDSCSVEKEIEELENKTKKSSIEISSFEQQIKEIENSITAIRSKIKNIKIEINKRNEKIEKISGIDSKIKILESKNEEILKNISSLDHYDDNFDIYIKKTEEEISESSLKIKEHFKTLDLLDHAKSVVSEDGVKTVITKKMLTFLNSKFNYYLANLDAPCTCTFDENFDITIKTNQNKEIDYGNLSGGEKRRVNSAIIFTFRDLLRYQTGFCYNFFAVDEWFDSAVDTKGLEKILDVLKHYANTNKECIYIISHNSYTSKFEFDDQILLVKKNGLTTKVG